MNKGNIKNFKKVYFVVLFLVISLLFFTFVFADKLLENEARQYLKEGIEAQISGNIDLAISLYTKAIYVREDYTKAINNLGTAYAQKGETIKAEEQYKKAISIDPYYSTALKNLAIIYAGRGDYEKFYEYWKRATGIDVYSPFLIDDKVDEEK